MKSGFSLGRSLRAAAKQAATLPVAARRSETLARFHWQSRLAAQAKTWGNPPVFATREALYEYVNGKYFGGGSEPMDYLEFGVYRGVSARRWLALNRNPRSRFYGFDSFEGLPEDWTGGKGRGTFSVDGQIPQIDDPRIRFVRGWFQHSLRPFLSSWASQTRLLVHNDSDIYTSTLYCLSTLDPLLVEGTIVIFDEFYDVLHEYRALTDYSSAFMREYSVVATTPAFGQVAIEMGPLPRTP